MNESIIKQRYLHPFRHHYERWPALAWFGAGMLMVAQMLSSDAPRLVLGLCALACFALSVPWMKRWFRLMETLERMQERNVQAIPYSNFDNSVHADKSKIFAGWGFDWSQHEAQMAHEVILADPKNIEQAYDVEAPGQSWIHGINTVESPIYLPVADEHTLIVAMTRWGKTVLFRLLIAQAVRRGEAVIVLDPKGDKGMRAATMQACHEAGQELLEFNMASPATSVRVDPMRTFDDASELASRVAALLGRSTKDKAFTDFSFMVLNNVCNGLLLCQRRPTLVSIKRVLDGGLEQLLSQAIIAYCNRELAPGWDASLDGYRRSIQARRRKSAGSSENEALILTPDEEAKALTAFYREKVSHVRGSSELDGLIATVEHDSEHRSKMLTSLMPVLTKLTSGPLARLLSADETDPGDTRKATDLARVVEQQRVLYVGLNALANEDVANAIGEILMADLAAVCGSRYNYANTRKVVSIFIDEAPELLIAELIKLLNKGGGGAFRLTLACQVIKDIEARLGSAAMAEKVIGNIANFIFGRVTAEESQSFFTERLMKVPIKSLEHSRTVSTQTMEPMEFTSSQGERLSVSMEPPIDPAMLGCLPKLQYFGLIGSRLVKARIPVLVADEA